MKPNQIAFFFLLLWGSIYSWGKPAKLPNIILILSDDQAWTDYGFMGHKDIDTPNLDRLASHIKIAAWLSGISNV